MEERHAAAESEPGVGALSLHKSVISRMNMFKQGTSVAHNVPTTTNGSIPSLISDQLLRRRESRHTLARLSIVEILAVGGILSVASVNS